MNIREIPCCGAEIKDSAKRRKALWESTKSTMGACHFTPHRLESFGIPEICLQLLCQTAPGKASQGLCPASCVLWRVRSVGCHFGTSLSTGIPWHPQPRCEPRCGIHASHGHVSAFGWQLASVNLQLHARCSINQDSGPTPNLLGTAWNGYTISSLTSVSECLVLFHDT